MKSFKNYQQIHLGGILRGLQLLEMAPNCHEIGLWSSDIIGYPQAGKYLASILSGKNRNVSTCLAFLLFLFTAAQREVTAL